jgi:hypothetical protein
MHKRNEISWRTSKEDNVHKTEVHLIEIVCNSVEWTGSVQDLITGFGQWENIFTI